MNKAGITKLIRGGEGIAVEFKGADQFRHWH